MKDAGIGALVRINGDTVRDDVVGIVADGLQAVLDRIAEMAPEDRALAERVHVTVTAAAPDLSPKTWYGMPAYAHLVTLGAPLSLAIVGLNSA